MLNYYFDEVRPEGRLRLRRTIDGSTIESRVRFRYDPDKSCIYFVVTVTGPNEHSLFPRRYFEKHYGTIAMNIAAVLTIAGVDLPETFRYRGIALSGYTVIAKSQV